MAASAICRDVWQRLPFDECLHYSEDVDWTHRAHLLGLSIVYVPEARFEHSHDYAWRALYRRMHGEGCADRQIFRRGHSSLKHDFLFPLGAQMVRDLRTQKLTPQRATSRVVAQVGRYVGKTLSQLEKPSFSNRGTAAIPRRPTFTLVGEGSMETDVAALLRDASARAWQASAPHSRALVLLGGYGCGEGGSRRKNHSYTIANDADFALIVSSKQAAQGLRSACRKTSEQIHRDLGIDVDIWPVAESELHRAQGRLLWVDAAVRGAKVMAGDSEILQPLCGLSSRHVAREELMRLLANRATGLALSRLAFAKKEEEKERAERHVWKAWIAAGDTFLVVLGRYHSRWTERVAALSQLAEFNAPHLRVLAHNYAQAYQWRSATWSSGMTEGVFERARSELGVVYSHLASHFLAMASLLHPPVPTEARWRTRSWRPVDIGFAARWLSGPRAALQQRIRWSQSLCHPRETLVRLAWVLAFEENDNVALQIAQHTLPLEACNPQSMQAGLEKLREVAA